MVNSLKESITLKLEELYPAYTIYDEEVPQNFKKPSFMINLIDQDYSKLIHDKAESHLNFDIAYFSNSKQINNDIQEVQLKLLRSFDLITNGDFKIRILNKRCSTTDKVLHFLFDLHYREINQDIFIKMKNQTTNTKQKEG